jgi:hypothetical protein
MDSNQTLHAPATEGLGSLDRDRAGSLADEGGVSAAAVESQEPRSRGERDRLWRAAAVGASLLVLAGLLFCQRPGSRQG